MYTSSGMYNAVPYIFHHDYCGDFFEYGAATMCMQDSTQRDFVNNLSRFLEKLKIDPSYPIAESLFKRMTARSIRFHTPVHILSMFQFAARKKLRLAWWEEVAIWFHNAICVPGKSAEDNKWASAKYMEAMMSPFISNKKLTTIAMSIHYMGRHYEKVPKQYHFLCDLDLAYLMFEQPGCFFAHRCLLKELQPCYKDDEDLWDAYKEMLVGILEKGSVFRSQCFAAHEDSTVHSLVNMALQNSCKQFLNNRTTVNV